ncbi:hypothetical protein GUJ93_ZPchr0009g2416 [Zizania palustris]|uniref:Uncharacterized protein n=1 Tax=Zizania palustris TaxID=103762 RepID=A0A8J5V946_ZIZPA|nr:hypothetical protein GUJ93_ZPchr0009g2416 [Zizania palustris]
MEHCRAPPPKPDAVPPLPSSTACTALSTAAPVRLVADKPLPRRLCFTSSYFISLQLIHQDVVVPSFNRSFLVDDLFQLQLCQPPHLISNEPCVLEDLKDIA